MTFDDETVKFADSTEWTAEDVERFIGQYGSSDFDPEEDVMPGVCMPEQWD